MCRYLPYFLFLVITPSVFAGEYGTEKYNSGWQFSTDNDGPVEQADRYYTGWISLTLSGKRVQKYMASIDPLRAGIDRLLGFSKLYQSSDYMSFHSLQYGMTLFTPDDIESNTPIYDDRPYASLIFMSNAEITVVPDKNRAYISILTIGLLGLDLAEDIQRFLHHGNFWRHQKWFYFQVHDNR
jgi:hypothetical protein